MDDPMPIMECETCGGADFHKDSGYYYCNECQTQSQVQEHVFENFDNANFSRKIQQAKPKNKIDEQLTSWECYNYILKGLTDELLTLGAKPQLRPVVRCLWMKYLHKCQVFDIDSDAPPKLNILGSKKDIGVLYNLKRRKRSRSRASSTSTKMSAKRLHSSKKRALIKSQYDSQNLTQDSSINDSLSNVKSDASDKSDTNEQIVYNKYSNRQLKGLMSSKHKREHEKDLNNDLTCHKLTARSFKPSFIYGPTNLTTFTLYSILYLGLLIVEDRIQLGDMLRFIREGHLSFGCYRHFFPEDEKILNLPQRRETLFSSCFFRKRSIKLAQFLNVCSYIKRPNLIELCSRYCRELNLPRSIFECCEKLILKTEPKMALDDQLKKVPNFEARAMSFILFVLKLLFGLDGVSEAKLSRYASIVGMDMFNFTDWLQFIGHRRIVMANCHLPTALMAGKLTSDSYLTYMKRQRVKFKGSSRPMGNEIKDYLQLFDKLLANNDEEDFDDEIEAFEPSLTPFLSYSTRLDLSSFESCSLDFLFRPEKYLKFATIKNGGANDNIIVEQFMYLYKSTILLRKKGGQIVTVKVGESDENLPKSEEKPGDPGKLLANWQRGHEKDFQKNRTFVRESPNAQNIDENYSIHYNTFERYWSNLPLNPLAHYFSKRDMEKLLKTMPYSLKMALEECSRAIEQDCSDFYMEFLATELYLCNFHEKRKKGQVELRKALECCIKYW